MKLAYTQVLGTCARKGVQVQVLSRPLFLHNTWELMKNAIRPLLLQVEVLVEDQQVWQNIQTLDPFSRC